MEALNLSWETLWPIGSLVLLGGLAYGMTRYYSRNRSNDKLTEIATRELYQDPEHFDEKREELKKQVRP